MKKKTPLNIFVSTGVDSRNIDYDFDGEAEMVCRCLSGEMLCMDCERSKPLDVYGNESSDS